MSTISISGAGYQLSGSPPCVDNTFLADQNSPLGALKDTLTIQRVTGLTTMLYPDMARQADRHMPLRGSSASRVDGVVDYKIGVGYDNLLSQTQLTDVTPSSAPYDDHRQLATACGSTRDKLIKASTNANAEGCNPAIDGPIPILGHEAYTRRGYVLRLPIPPLCLAAFTNKEKFHDSLAAILNAVQNATITAFSAGRLRWMIEQSRFNASPIQVSQGGGTAKLPVSTDLFSSGDFNRVPEHYGSADWFAAMLRLTELPRNASITVELPSSIFEKYKTDIANVIGFSIYEQASNLTNALNGFTRSILNDTLVYQDRATGRKISFVATSSPTYIEVVETGPGKGEWFFQEPHIFRDSETPNQVFPRENPNYGVACSCPGRILAALVTVSIDGAQKPFAMESFPVNPDPGLRALINRYAKSRNVEVNTTLAELYPTMVETTLFTGLELQVWMLDKLNQRFRDAGYTCDVVSNIENTWIGGFTKISGVFVEENPRQVVNFLLRVPQQDNCVSLFTVCEEPGAIPAGGEGIVPGFTEIPKQTLVIDPPPTPPTPSAGLVQVIKKSSTVTAPCVGAPNKVVKIPLRRVGGSAGAVDITIAVSGPVPAGTAHIIAPVTPVHFADGVTEITVPVEITAWECPTTGPVTETYTLTFGGAALDPETFITHKICVKCAAACPTDCEAGAGGCAACG